MKFAEDKVPVF